MSVVHWSASESRIVEPWARSDASLQGIRFRLVPEAEFWNDAIVWLDREAIPSPFRPEFLLDLDPHDLAERVGIPVGDLRTAVIVRDRALKRWRAIESWPLAESPSSYVLRISPEEFALGRRMEFVLVVAPAQRLPERTGRAHRPDQVVASRSFEVAVRKDGSRFNVATVEPAWFEEAGLPKDTVWAIDWDTRDPSSEPIAALTVVVNERSADKLQAVLGADASASALAAQIAIDVFVEASYVVLQNAGDFDAEPGTMLGAVIGGLGIDTARDFEELKSKVQDDAGRVTALSMLRARVQARIGLGRTLAKSRVGSRA